LSFIEKQLNKNILSETTLKYLNHEPGDVVISEPDSQIREKLTRWLDQEGVLFTPSDERFIAALSGDHFVGMCAFKPDKDCIRINYLYVTPDQRRKGVGLRLIRSIFQKYNTGSSGWFQVEETSIDLIRVLIKSGYSFKVK
jgi:GNAT superfamily N-acetyltransferase